MALQTWSPPGIGVRQQHIILRSSNWAATQNTGYQKGYHLSPQLTINSLIYRQKSVSISELRSTKVNTDTLDWEYYIMPMMFAYNTSFHRAMKTSPFIRIDIRNWNKNHGQAILWSEDIMWRGLWHGTISKNEVMSWNGNGSGKKPQ